MKNKKIISIIVGIVAFIASVTGITGFVQQNIHNSAQPQPEQSGGIHDNTFSNIRVTNADSVIQINGGNVFGNKFNNITANNVKHFVETNP